MILNIDPMPMLRADAEKKVNNHFNSIGAVNAQQDAEHTLKRREAEKIAIGMEPSADFSSMATVEGMTPTTLASVILTKPDDVAQRAIQRRKAILAVRAAKIPAELAFVDNLHVS
jgi:hypothetical protein